MRAAFIGIIAFLLTSCAYRIPPVSLSTVPDKRMAIFYGHFQLGSDYNMGNKLALWLENLDTHHSVYLFFDEKQPLCAVQVEPGQYRIRGFAGTDRLYKIIFRREFKLGSLRYLSARPFAAPAGSEIYLGDFTGSATLGGFYQEWKINSFTNNFSETTVEFREKFPNLMAVPARSMFELQSRASFD